MENHTPGPWGIFDRKAVVIVGHGKQICQATSDYTMEDGEQQANARLIAAAPETLSILKGCRDMLRESAKHFRCLNQSGFAAMADTHANQADAIIAKTEGRNA